MSEPNIREIAETFNGTAWDGTHVGALAADWLRLTAPLGDEKLAEIEARHAASDGDQCLCGLPQCVGCKASSTFQVHSYSDVGALLQEIRRLQMKLMESHL